MHKQDRDLAGTIYIVSHIPANFIKCECASLLSFSPLDPVNICSNRPGAMSGLGGHFAVEFARETWALYAVGILGAALRW